MGTGKGIWKVGGEPQSEPVIVPRKMEELIVRHPIPQKARPSNGPHSQWKGKSPPAYKANLEGSSSRLQHLMLKLI